MNNCIGKYYTAVNGVADNNLKRFSRDEVGSAKFAACYLQSFLLPCTLHTRAIVAVACIAALCRGHLLSGA
jgi:hypothetical protein